MDTLAAAVAGAPVPDGASVGFEPPAVDWVAVWPVTAVLSAAVIGVLVEAFVPRAARRWTQLALAVVGLLVGFAGTLVLWGGEVRFAISYPQDPETAAMQLDKVSIFLQMILLLMSLLAVLVIAERGRGQLDAFAAQAATVPGTEDERLAGRLGRMTTEVFPLTMFAVGGMMIFAAAADLLTMFVALEVFSLPLYIMCGLARRRRLLSQEASLKYFLLGAFSSALFLYGIALVYGITGTVSIAQMGQGIGRAGQTLDVVAAYPVLVVGVLLILVGLLFKIGAVPFHSWTPDVYAGAPTPITGFMAACTKVAAFGALLRVLYSGLPSLENDWGPALAVVAALTMVLGSLVALRQTDLKRMLAYSSIAHAGFILTGLVSVQASGITSVLFYLLAYGFSTIAAFAVLTLVREQDEDGGIGGEATHLSQWAGLGRRSPLLAASFTALLLAFAGIPLTSGFTAKFGVFSSAVEGGLAWLAVLGVLASAAAAFFYVRVIVLMYFTEPSGERGTVVEPGPLTVAAITVGVVVTLVLGVYPAPFLDLAGALTAAAP